MLRFAHFTLAALVVSVLHAQPIAPVDCLEVIDATGKKVGNVMGSVGVRDVGASNTFTAEVPVAVKLTSDGTVFILHATRSGLRGNSDLLVFQSSDCSGPGWIFPSDQSLFPHAVVTYPNNTLFVEQSGAAPQNIAIASAKIDGDQTGFCQPTGGTVSFVPATPVAALDTLFTGPFSVTECQTRGKGKNK